MGVECRGAGRGDLGCAMGAMEWGEGACDELTWIGRCGIIGHRMRRQE